MKLQNKIVGLLVLSVLAFSPAAFIPVSAQAQTTDETEAALVATLQQLVLVLIQQLNELMAQLAEQNASGVAALPAPTTQQEKSTEQSQAEYQADRDRRQAELAAFEQAQYDNKEKDYRLRLNQLSNEQIQVNSLRTEARRAAILDGYPLRYTKWPSFVDTEYKKQVVQRVWDELYKNEQVRNHHDRKNTRSLVQDELKTISDEKQTERQLLDNEYRRWLLENE